MDSQLNQSNTNILSWVKTHKKLILVVISIIFLFVVLIFAIIPNFKNKLLPLKKLTESKQATQEQKQNTNKGSIWIQTPKNTFSMNETIKIKGYASSAGQEIRAFDALIKYDPAFVSLAQKKSPTRPEFLYYASNTGGLLQISAVQKPDSNKNVVFNNSGLFEFEFTAKKTGKTFFKMVFTPNSTSNSNLIDIKSKNILGSAKGKEITIK